MHVTVSQMNQDIGELQKSIGLQNIRFEESKAREEDLKQQLSQEREIVRQRDRNIDNLMSEATQLRK